MLLREKDRHKRFGLWVFRLSDCCMYKSIQKTLLPRIAAPLVDWFYLDAIEGQEQLPRTGPFILAGNHVSVPDAWLLMNFFVRHRAEELWFISRDDIWWGRRWTKLVVPSFGSLLVDWRKPSAVLEQALGVLRKKWVVGIFPEATRNTDPDVLCLGKTGAVRLALASGAPIVPFGYVGPTIATPWDVVREFGLRRNCSRIVFGKPIDYSAYQEKNITRELLYDLTDGLMTRIGKLCAKQPRLHRR